ncbi:MAG: 16S rRNA (uracil(1498)-N(3))-methyltransferase [Acidobacteriota bacterium]|nr:16S rRNA (uracil(1498)-N(3))-methyltransferase [Acidobacteriota bacterium]
MTRRRFHASPESFARDGTSVVLEREETQHLRSVLRLKAGDEVFVFDGAGREFACVVREGEHQSEMAAVLDVRGQVAPQRPESPHELTLAIALLKGEKFDLVVRKATELGVNRIVPILTKRTDVRPRDERDAVGRQRRWQRLALEAAKQSGRARIPQVCAPASFSSLLDNTAGVGTFERRLIIKESSCRGLAETLRDWQPTPGNAAALVGPEGGWETEELEQAAHAGWHLITLGGRTLRAETAALTVVALLQHLWGDLK